MKKEPTLPRIDRSGAAGGRSARGRAPVLGRRALNRALLARQFLLRRRRAAVDRALEHLVGLQAQRPTDPYVALWSRIDRLRPDDVSRLLIEREAVRASLMRATIHLVTADDALALRPVVQPVLERAWSRPDRRRETEDIVAEVVAAGRALVEERPRSRSELRRMLAERWPDRSADALADTVAFLLPMVQVPPRGVWGEGRQPLLTTADSWIGRPLAASPSPDDLVLRYLGAFGPASVIDAQTWSGLTRLREVFERMRPHLRLYRDENGQELFDVAEAPRPSPETVAPVRFLPEFDNLLLSHGDRARVVTEAYRASFLTNEMRGRGSLLVDGFAIGRWRLVHNHGHAFLEVEPLIRLSKRARDDVIDEGTRLAAFLAPGSRTHVRFAART